MTTTTPTQTVNGIEVAKVAELIGTVAKDPRTGMMKFGASTRWIGGTKTETRIAGFQMGGQTKQRNFTLVTDEPLELAGTNTQPNPQEYLMTALNSCMMVGFVAGAAMHNITLDKLEIDCEGELDLRGFLGLDPSVKPGYDTVHYTVRISGNGTPAQFAEIHQTVMKTSPNRFNFANPIKLTSNLIVE